MIRRHIYCCGCEKMVMAELVEGADVYPHRKDLAKLPFWRCGRCTNFVGCHHKTADRTRPLGVIPTPELKAARQQIHAVLDPLWQSGKYRRGQVYARLSKALGYTYHTANIRTIEEAGKVYDAVLEMC